MWMTRYDLIQKGRVRSRVRARWSAASAVPVWDTEGCGSVPTPVTSLQGHSETIQPVSRTDSVQNTISVNDKHTVQQVSFSSHFLELWRGDIHVLVAISRRIFKWSFSLLIWWRIMNTKIKKFTINLKIIIFLYSRREHLMTSFSKHVHKYLDRIVVILQQCIWKIHWDQFSG